MTQKYLVKQHWIIIMMMTAILFSGLACNLLGAQPQEPEVVEELPLVEEPEPIEEPVEEPGFTPELAMRLEPTEPDHTVSSVAFSHDGTQIAIGSYILIDIFGAADGALISSLADLPHSVKGLAFTPDDQSIFGAFSLGGVNRYSLADGELMIDFHGGYDNYLALSPDGTQIATGNRSGETWVWNAGNGEQTFELNPADHVEDHSDYLISLAYSPDGGIIAAGDWNGYIFLWDANSGDLIRYIEPETDFCGTWGLSFSPDGQYLAVGGHNVSFDPVVKIYNVADGEQAWVLDEASRPGSGSAPVAFSPDGTLLAAGAMDGITLWSVPEMTFLAHLEIEDTEATDWVTALAFSPDSRTLAAGYWNNYALVWQVQE